MFNYIKERSFPFIIALSAIAVSGSAAFYSVSGLSKLFAGASLEVIIMATSLEVSKLVIASLLYQYWGEINKILRTYLTIAAGVLILITSMGIYGFLSNAYVQTATLAQSADSQITLLESKKQNLIEQKNILTQEKSEILKNVTDLRSGLTNNVQTTKDKRGNILTSSSSANRTTFEKQLDKTLNRQEIVNIKLDTLNSQIFQLENKILETKTGNDASSELGPLKYISNLTKVPMDNIVNWLLLIIIFVFDPLAIALVIAANFAFARLKPTPPSTQPNVKEYEIYNEIPLSINEESFPLNITSSIPLEEDIIISDPIEDFDDEFPSSSYSENQSFANLSTWKKRKINKSKKSNSSEEDDYVIKY